MPSNNETNIVVTGRHIEVTEAIREFAHKKIEAIHIDYPRIVEARVVVDAERSACSGNCPVLCGSHHDTGLYDRNGFVRSVG